MPGTCPDINRCNTDASGWLSEPHPSTLEGIVTRKVCYHWSGDCCNWSNTIQVLNCGGFYIYKLVPPPACQLRYCGTGSIISKYIMYIDKARRHTRLCFHVQLEHSPGMNHYCFHYACSLAPSQLTQHEDSKFHQHTIVKTLTFQCKPSQNQFLNTNTKLLRRHFNDSLYDFIVYTDVDECAADSHDCHVLATCTDTQESFICACNLGYTGDGKSTCSGTKRYLS